MPTSLGAGVVSLSVGSAPGSGTYFCSSCGSQLALREAERLPECPRCGANEYQRDSIFAAMQEHGATVELTAPEGEDGHEWLPLARAMIVRAGRYMTYREDSGEIRLFSIETGWTRIGRSANADIRLDDPSVSRRHALIVSEQPSSLRVLDDRSLNGVFLNGSLIDWGRLGDGDELAIGRYRLFALEA